MNKIVRFPNARVLREQVGTWIARIDRGLSAGERVQLQRWLNENSRHRAALFEMAELWDRMDIMSEIAEFFPLQAKISGWTRLRARPVMVSLLVLMGVGAAGIWIRGHSMAMHSLVGSHPTRDSAALEATYSTTVGEKRTVRLPDQSIVTLNTATLLRAHYTDTERKMELLQGEAHFEVAKHQGRVFIVQVGASEFRAVGTAFDIRVESERGIELTVTEGRVQVRTPSSAEVGHVMRPGAGQSAATEIIVDAGKEVAIDTSIQTVQPLQPAQLEAVLAWKSGMIIFDAAPLEKAIREVSRYSTTKFVIVDERTKKLPVSGYFKVGDVNGLVTTLHNNFRIDATRNGDVVILSAAK